MTRLLSIIILLMSSQVRGAFAQDANNEWRILFYHGSATAEGDKSSSSFAFPLICYSKKTKDTLVGPGCDVLSSKTEITASGSHNSILLQQRRNLNKNALAMRLGISSAYETNLSRRDNRFFASYPKLELLPINYGRTFSMPSSETSVKVTSSEERELEKQLRLLVGPKKKYETFIVKYQDDFDQNGQIDTLFIVTAGTAFDPENPNHPALGLLSAVFIARNENPTAMTFLTKFKGEVVEISDTLDLRGGGSKLFLLEHYSEHGGYLSFDEIKDGKWINWLDHLPN